MSSLTSRRAFCGALTSAAVPAHAAARRPNVILVITDDQGYGDLACHGNPVIRTRHLDRLHSESVRFTNFHVDPLCSPTRSALMTGRYACRTGVWATIMGRSLLRRDEVSMAEVFSASGYRTGIFGKWHLGDNYPFRPQDRGFGEALVHGGGGVGQTPDYWGNTYFDDTYFRHGKPEKSRGYCTDVFFDAALRFIEAQRDRPFFVYLPTNAPHSPFNVAERYSRPYREQGLPAQLASFYGMITNIDENMGRLRASLKQLGLEDNTLLVWMTDNGSALGVMRADGTSGFWGFNAGMRGAKGSPYEGGHRVPCFMRWPAAGIAGGRDIPRLAAHIDLLPTLIELAGLNSPRGVAFDGTSLAPLVTVRGGLAERTLVVQVHQRQENGKWAMEQPRQWLGSAVMTDRWRLVNGGELYDLGADPGQTTDVAAGHAAVAAGLRKTYEDWYADVTRRAGEYCSIVLGSERENPVRLTCHDWHGDVVPWNHATIRKMPVANGFWAVEVERPGRYEFTLRHWPVEEDLALKAVSARVRIADADHSVPVTPGSSSVTLTADLKAGNTRLETWLTDRDGVSRGAFFVYVRRLTAGSRGSAA